MTWQLVYLGSEYQDFDAMTDDEAEAFEAQGEGIIKIDVGSEEEGTTLFYGYLRPGEVSWEPVLAIDGEFVPPKGKPEKIFVLIKFTCDEIRRVVLEIVDYCAEKSITSSKGESLSRDLRFVKEMRLFFSWEYESQVEDKSIFD